METVTQKEMVRILKRKQGDRTAFAMAKEMGVSPQYLADFFAGRRTPGPLILDYLGIERIYTFKKQRNA